MSFENLTDSPMKRFSTFWLWLLLVSVFGLVALFFTPWLKDRDNTANPDGEARLAIKKTVDAAQEGAKEKIEESFSEAKGALLTKPAQSSKALPGAAPAAAAPAVEDSADQAAKKVAAEKRAKQVKKDNQIKQQARRAAKRAAAEAAAKSAAPTAPTAPSAPEAPQP